MGIPDYNPFRDAAGYTFHVDRAERYRTFIETQITHIEGKVSGQPYILQPHELSIVYNLFGWYNAKTNLRRYREALFFVPRKNSKSTFAASLLNAVMFMDGEARMQNYSLGANLDQANIIKRIANAQVLANPELLKRVKIYKSTHAFELLADGSIYRSLTADAGTKHGLNTHFCVADEIHAYPNSELIDVIKTSMGARQQPLMLYTTTSDYQRESVCNKVYDYACKVRDGVLCDAGFLPVIFEISQEEFNEYPDCWKDPVYWAKANPMLGKSVSLEFLHRECQRAMDDPSYENTFKRLYLNIRTETSERMIASDRWSLNDGAFPTGHFTGRVPLAASLDCGSTSDSTSFNILYEAQGGEGYESIWFHWMPRDKANEYERKYAKPFSVWEREGWVTLTDGDIIHYDRIRDEILGLCGMYGVKTIAVDPLFQSVQLCQQLQDEGLEVEYWKCNMVNMTAPTGEALRFINSGALRHGDNGFMREQSANAVLSRRQEMCMPDKAKSAGKIDGIVTLIMSMATALLKRKPKASVYETRGFLVFGDTDE